MRCLVYLLILLAPGISWGHPVSYQGAISLMSYNTDEQNELLLTYSFKHYLAGGIEYFQRDDVAYSVPRLNFLLQRWNNEDSQGNFYLSGGYGSERSYDESVGVGFASVEADWESRKYYVSSLYSRYFRQDSDTIKRSDFEMMRFRVGVAPYLGEFSELNTWLILEADKMTDTSTELTQIIRLFYKNTLIELGARFGGGWSFNYMVHF